MPVEPDEADAFAGRSSGKKRVPISQRWLIPQWGLWLLAAASSGIGAGVLFPDDGPNQLPIPALLTGFFGFGIWLAAIHKAKRYGGGWAADVLFGIFVSADLFKWGFLAGMALHGSFGRAP